MDNLQLRQLFDRESCTYTYFLFDEKSKELAIIDPVSACLQRDQLLISELGLSVKFIFETHVHADHLTSAALLKEKFGGSIIVSKKGEQKGADQYLKGGESLKLGQSEIQCLYTPGHTNTCFSYLVEGKVFTGDTLFIRGCGRTDFQSGSNKDLFHSVREILFQLPNETKIYPGHDYQGRTYSTIGEEKIHNPRLKLENGFEEFAQIMDSLNLDYPKKMDEVLPGNLTLGAQ